ncbi:lasso RiPP family leader peptide-containing protein (plasmid) [Streptomyces sp. QTS137]
MLRIEPADTYESPLMVEVGDFAEHTQGAYGDKTEAGFGKYDDD